jgi:hypothetical protein
MLAASALGEQFKIAVIDATSPLPLTLSIDGLGFHLSRTDTTLGVIVNDTDYSIHSTEFLRGLLSRAHSIFGRIVIGDNRTSCFETSSVGSCTVSAQFEISVAQFNPGCPSSFHVFAQNNVSVSWTPPAITMRDGTVLRLIGSHSPGDLFTLGTTTITYKASFDRSQTSDTRLSCSFNVRLYRAFD